MSDFKLLDVIRISGRIEVMTGLRIGGSVETMEISGLDNPIIRNPRSAEPFIPGSSIKGRMRSLAEWYFDELPPGGRATDSNPDSETAGVFGVGAKSGSRRGPTRLIVRDALLSESSRHDLREGWPITEVKSENSINRLTSEANPRPVERVLPGVQFYLEIVYRVLDTGDGGEIDRRRFDNVLLVAMALLEADALGGGGSRGNGKIAFRNLTRNGEPLALPSLSFARAANS